MSDSSMFLLGLVTGAILACSGQIALYVVRPWVRALLSGAHVPWPLIVAMRLRGNPPGRIIDTYVQLKKRGRLISLSQIEARYMAYKESASSVEALVRMMEEEYERQVSAPVTQGKVLE